MVRIPHFDHYVENKPLISVVINNAGKAADEVLHNEESEIG